MLLMSAQPLKASTVAGALIANSGLPLCPQLGLLGALAAQFNVESLPYKFVNLYINQNYSFFPLTNSTPMTLLGSLAFRADWDFQMAILLYCLSPMLPIICYQLLSSALKRYNRSKIYCMFQACCLHRLKEYICHIVYKNLPYKRFSYCI